MIPLKAEPLRIIAVQRNGIGLQTRPVFVDGHQVTAWSPPYDRLSREAPIDATLGRRPAVRVQHLHAEGHGIVVPLIDVCLCGPGAGGAGEEIHIGGARPILGGIVTPERLGSGPIARCSTARGAPSAVSIVKLTPRKNPFTFISLPPVSVEYAENTRDDMVSAYLKGVT